MAQSANDVVYLNNGDVIKGTISSIIPDETVTIQALDESLFVLNMSEVTQISHEENADGIISFPDWANDVMTKKGSKLFIGDKELSASELQELLNENLYKVCANGATKLDIGNYLILGGIVCSVISIGLLVASNNTQKESTNFPYHYDQLGYEKSLKQNNMAKIVAFPSFAFLTCGFIFREIGNDRLRYIVDEYNNSFVNRVSFNLQPGIISTNGLALQNSTIAPGLKFTMTF